MAHVASLGVDEALAEAPLTPAEFALYSRLRFEAPLTITEVAQRSGSPVTTVSQVLKRIDGRGHLSREPNPEDARSTVVSLTAAGLDAHTRTASWFEPVIGAIDARLGGERAQIVFSLVRLDQAIREVAGDPVRSDERLDRVRPDDASTHTVTYAGDPLTTEEEDEARAFVEWLRHRRTAAP